MNDVLIWVMPQCVPLKKADLKCLVVISHANFIRSQLAIPWISVSAFRASATHAEQDYSVDLDPQLQSGIDITSVCTPMQTRFTTPPSNVPLVPQELIDEIIEEAILTSPDPKETAIHCSLISRTTLSHSQAILFDHITISINNPPSEWLDIFMGWQHLAAAVQHLKIEAMETSWVNDFAILMSLIATETTPLKKLFVCDCNIRFLIDCGASWDHVKTLYMTRCYHDPASILKWIQSLPCLHHLHYMGDAFHPLYNTPNVSEVDVNALKLLKLNTFMCYPTFASSDNYPILWMLLQLMPALQKLSAFLFVVEPSQFLLLMQIIKASASTLECLATKDQTNTGPLELREVTIRIKYSYSVTLPDAALLMHLSDKVNKGQVVGVGGCCDLRYYSRWELYDMLLHTAALAALDKCYVAREEYRMIITEEPFGPDDNTLVIWDVHTRNSLDRNPKELNFPMADNPIPFLDLTRRLRLLQSNQRKKRWRMIKNGATKEEADRVYPPLSSYQSKEGESAEDTARRLARNAKKSATARVHYRERAKTSSEKPVTLIHYQRDSNGSLRKRADLVSGILGKYICAAADHCLWKGDPDLQFYAGCVTGNDGGNALAKETDFVSHGEITVEFLQNEYNIGPFVEVEEHDSVKKQSDRTNPTVATTVSNLDDGSQAMAHTKFVDTEKFTLPREHVTDQTWALLHHGGTLSHWHRDTDGKLTLIMVDQGCKLWIEQHPQKSLARSEIDAWFVQSMEDNDEPSDGDMSTMEMSKSGTILILPGDIVTFHLHSHTLVNERRSHGDTTAHLGDFTTNVDHKSAHTYAGFYTNDTEYQDSKEPMYCLASPFPVVLDDKLEEKPQDIAMRICKHVGLAGRNVQRTVSLLQQFLDIGPVGRARHKALHTNCKTATILQHQPALSLHVLVVSRPDIHIFNEEAVVLICFSGERPRLDKLRTHVDLNGITQMDFSGVIPCIIKVTGIIIPGQEVGTYSYYSIAMGPPNYSFSHVGSMVKQPSVFPAVVVKHSSHDDGLIVDINFNEYDKLCNIFKFSSSSWSTRKAWSLSECSLTGRVQTGAPMLSIAEDPADDGESGLSKIQRILFESKNEVPELNKLQWCRSILDITKTLTREDIDCLKNRCSTSVWAALVFCNIRRTAARTLEDTHVCKVRISDWDLFPALMVPACMNCVKKKHPCSFQFSRASKCRECALFGVACPKGASHKGDSSLPPHIVSDLKRSSPDSDCRTTIPPHRILLGIGNRETLEFYEECLHALSAIIHLTMMIDFPDELKLRILQSDALSPSDLLACCLTGTSLLPCALEALYARIRICNTYRLSTWIQYFLDNLERCTWVFEIQIETCWIPTDGWNELLNLFPNLRAIHFTDVYLPHYLEEWRISPHLPIQFTFTHCYLTGSGVSKILGLGNVNTVVVRDGVAMEPCKLTVESGMDSMQKIEHFIPTMSFEDMDLDEAISLAAIFPRNSIAIDSIHWIIHGFHVPFKMPIDIGIVDLNERHIHFLDLSRCTSLKAIYWCSTFPIAIYAVVVHEYPPNA
ncbi:uncharacterized protein EV420DRAFT_1488279 [Desarmillaria tabescens]|uniref:Uncharacterized protein n=1 Tax=Armillaria tabescens TaxID=1929756 RepID=A0AA39J3V8_ARMTA|nr:uncharacterized protein EV420DRAFT_1488279 [Desarmillaria tabescens]KAK0435000.1 hypothetical protein EV420DRAFT_1488279 [Desarmillaria tabescens]